ncbi:hypothetical protein CC85DRAFT_281983 [Cutaneotrichosporon oleaginosum]|uniref:Uncharacterized protein n=1 Tax=Cutaneotrichosporon oleaginosum TaxID=879819 RepID=A0A0J0XXM4_9TREE|nr:uncharacterized protein CC85DRAFT_281983 [Cutaneotrichosporon oleaginosum]KLT45830.1 hypothetical protein CC85DRAFT_281983 [Cutaneotrichosporon oleaginosum]TXT06536.1 hypothetical protein COLE_05867 [Cutaneotrichosporon oleaginosum]
MPAPASYIRLSGARDVVSPTDAEPPYIRGPYPTSPQAPGLRPQAFAPPGPTSADRGGTLIQHTRPEPRWRVGGGRADTCAPSVHECMQEEQDKNGRHRKWRRPGGQEKEDGRNCRGGDQCRQRD